MNLVILCDFDGTIVEIDTAEYALMKFAKGDWRKFDKQLEKGEINLEECMQKQYSMLRVPKAVLLEELEKVTSFRPNFGKLVDYCTTWMIRFVIISAGLDFFISHFLNIGGWQDLVEVHAAKTNVTDKGIELTFPDFLDKTSIDFKDDLVKSYKQQGYRVIYIGDGLSDYGGITKADVAFVIRDSSLSSLCIKERIQHREFNDFQDIIDFLEVIDRDANKNLISY